MSLERFLIAQADPATGFNVAIAELRNGQKMSHWIWYIFPQLRGLGRSSMAEFYGIENLEEARAYLREPTLREHLLSAMQVVAGHLAQGVRLDTLMGGSVDSLKLVSCVTLFRKVADHSEEFPEIPEIPSIQKLTADILSVAEAQDYSECQQTLSLCETME